MRNDYKDLLHMPDRANHMESLEDHLNTAAELARALWIASNSEDAFHDKRDRDGFQRLASVLADHATAALYAFYNNEQKGGAGR